MLRVGVLVFDLYLAVLVPIWIKYNKTCARALALKALSQTPSSHLLNVQVRAQTMCRGTAERRMCVQVLPARTLSPLCFPGVGVFVFW